MNTTEEVVCRDVTERVATVLVELLIVVPAVVGNLAVIFVVQRETHLREQDANLLIQNLAVTDCGVAVLVMLPSALAVSLDDWYLGHFACSLHCCFNYMFIIVSMMTLAMISVDRAIAVTIPLHYKIRVTRSRLIFSISVFWVCGSTFGLVPMLFDWIEYDYCETVCAINWFKHDGALIYVSVAFTICFSIPAATLLICNIIIIVTVRHCRFSRTKVGSVTTATTNSANNCASGTSRAKGANEADNMKVLWTMMTLIIAFFVLMAPFSITKLLKVAVKEKTVVPCWFNVFASFFQFMASAINPFIYGMLRRDFRNAFFRLVKVADNS